MDATHFRVEVVVSLEVLYGIAISSAVVAFVGLVILKGFYDLMKTGWRLFPVGFHGLRSFAVALASADALHAIVDVLLILSASYLIVTRVLMVVGADDEEA